MRVLTRHFLNAPDAVCNDGSPAAYYFSAATIGARANVWVLFQEGGGWCWDGTSCADRQRTFPGLMTSNGSSAYHLAKAGSVLDAPDSVSYAGANSVYLRYCTSDGYIGDRAASAATGGLAFRGRRVVEATIAALATRHGLGQGSIVVYSGCSAGGRGVMHNLNYVSDQVAVLAGPAARTIGLIDSGLYIDMTPLPSSEGGGANFTALREQAKGIVQYTNAAVDPTCAAKFAGPQRYRCLLGEYAIGNGTLRAAHLVHAFQFDAVQLCILLNLKPFSFDCWRLTAQQVVSHAGWSSAIRSFRDRTRGVLLGGGALPHGLAVHSAACYKHCNTESAAFSEGYRVGGISLAAALERFAFGGEQPMLIENCTGYACGADCKPTATAA